MVQETSCHLLEKLSGRPRASRSLYEFQVTDRQTGHFHNPLLPYSHTSTVFSQEASDLHSLLLLRNPSPTTKTLLTGFWGQFHASVCVHGSTVSLRLTYHAHQPLSVFKVVSLPTAWCLLEWAATCPSAVSGSMGGEGTWWLVPSPHQPLALGCLSSLSFCLVRVPDGTLFSSNEPCYMHSRTRG